MLLKSQLLKGALELCMLALLDREPAYAPLIVERLAEAGLHEISEGTIYPALGRLEREGLVAGERVPSPAGPPRKYHRTTDLGRLRLTELATEWRALEEAVDSLLAERSPAL